MENYIVNVFKVRLKNYEKANYVGSLEALEPSFEGNSEEEAIEEAKKWLIEDLGAPYGLYFDEEIGHIVEITKEEDEAIEKEGWVYMKFEAY